MSKIDEILKILDLTEQKQIKWLKNLYYKNEDNPDYSLLIDFYMGQESLADLAFRLRDEADKIRFAQGVGVVYANTKPRPLTASPKAIGGWLIADSQPIHWICAALIAKELAKELADSPSAGS